jgi:hypothetical protein
MKVRSLLVALIALTWLTSSVVQAQPRQGGSRPTPPPPPQAPTQTVPPPIVLPFPPLMTPPAGGLTRPLNRGLTQPPRFPENLPFQTPGRPIRGRSGGAFFGSGGYGPYFDYADRTTASQAPAMPSAPAIGWLRLALAPTNAQVFVDGYYVGTVDDVNARHGLQLDAGAHRIRFVAPQHQPLTVDVQIAPNDTVTYRGTLEPAMPTPPPAPRAAGPPAPMYMIPNCYLGNVPPRASRLPAGCDVKRVQVLNSK